MMLPSEALNREHVLDEDLMNEVKLVAEVTRVTTHAVLVGDIGLMLPSGEVSELVDRLPVCKLPNTPGWFSGVSSLRGHGPCGPVQVATQENVLHNGLFLLRRFWRLRCFGR